MALTVAQYEELVDLLQEVPALVDELEARDSSFLDNVLAWMKRLEKALTRNRLPVVAQVAVHRAELLQAARGVDRGGLRVAGRPSTGKIRDATAAFLLARSAEAVQDTIRERQKVFDEAGRVGQQLLAIARAKRLHEPYLWDDATQASLQHLCEQMATDSDVGSLYAHLAGMVGRTDVLVILERARAAVM